MKAKKRMNGILKGLLIALLAVIFVVCGYVVYFISAFNRIEDNLALSPTDAKNTYGLSLSIQYNLLSWNLGFGAYSDDYSFFMDGGKYSRAFSEEAVKTNYAGIQQAVTNAANVYSAGSFDIICYQEVDFDSTRSYHVDQRKILTQFHQDYSSTYAQNYNSPYILYPFNSPHGANKSGLLTFSKYQINSAIRKQLPIESGFTQFFDLDRCYSKNRISVTNGKDLVLINFHLSAYTSDGTIATKQLELVLADCKEEIEKGNYVICAGDFNKDLIDEGSGTLFGFEAEPDSWAKTIDPAVFENTGMQKVAPVTKENPVPTCRNANRPYSEGNTVYVIDGFLVSENVSVVRALTLNEQFRYSDHNPVLLTFKLNIS